MSDDKSKSGGQDRTLISLKTTRCVTGQRNSA